MQDTQGLLGALHAEAAATCRVVPPAIVTTAASLPYAHATGAVAIVEHEWLDLLLQLRLVAVEPAER